MDARGPKIPREPEEPFPAMWVPTPAATAARALADWIERNPHHNAGGVRSLRDRDTVLVYWKGAPPAGLQSLAAVQVSAGPSKDYSGISVHLKPEALVAKVVAELSAEAEVPVVCDGVGDSGPLTGGEVAGE